MRELHISLDVPRSNSRSYVFTSLMTRDYNYNVAKQGRRDDVRWAALATESSRLLEAPCASTCGLLLLWQ